MTTEIYHSVSLRINIKGGGLHCYMTFDQQCSISVVKQCKLMDGEAPWFRGNTGLHSMRFNVMFVYTHCKFTDKRFYRYCDKAIITLFSYMYW